MVRHRTRLIVLGSVLVLVIAALVSGARFGASHETMAVLAEVALGVLALLGTADAMAVERRRRDPKVPALPDDERSP